MLKREKYCNFSLKNESQISTWHSVRFSGTTENFLSVKASIINHTAKIHLQGILVRQQIMPPPLHTETSSTYDDLTFKLKNCAFLETFILEKAVLIKKWKTLVLSGPHFAAKKNYLFFEYLCSTCYLFDVLICFQKMYQEGKRIGQ